MTAHQIFKFTTTIALNRQCMNKQIIIILGKYWFVKSQDFSRRFLEVCEPWAGTAVRLVSEEFWQLCEHLQLCVMFFPPFPAQSVKGPVLSCREGLPLLREFCCPDGRVCLVSRNVKVGGKCHINIHVKPGCRFPPPNRTLCCKIAGSVSSPVCRDWLIGEDFHLILKQRMKKCLIINL